MNRNILEYLIDFEWIYSTYGKYSNDQVGLTLDKLDSVYNNLSPEDQLYIEERIKDIIQRGPRTSKTY